MSSHWLDTQRRWQLVNRGIIVAIGFVIGFIIMMSVMNSSKCPKLVGKAVVTYRLVDGHWLCTEVSGDVEAARRAMKECQL